MSNKNWDLISYNQLNDFLGKPERDIEKDLINIISKVRFEGYVDQEGVEFCEKGDIIKGLREIKNQIIKYIQINFENS